MTELTDEQRARIAVNKQEALKRREQREAENRINENKQLALQRQREAELRRTSAPFANIENKDVENKQQALQHQREAELKRTSAPLVAINTKKPRLNNSNQAPFSFPPRTLQNYRPKVTISFEVYTPTTVKVKFEPYLDDIKTILRSFSGSRYLPDVKQWVIGFENYKKAVAELKSLKTAICTVIELPDWVHYVFGSTAKINSSPVPTLEKADALLARSKVDRCLINTLFPYQRIGVAFGLQKQGKLLIGDEMGLGKTIQALAIAREYLSEWPLLIVCPSSVKFGWRQTFQRFLPGFNHIVVIEKGSDRLPTWPDSVIVMSYDQMSIKEKELEAVKYKVVIFDESHMLKEPKTKRTKMAIKMAGFATRKILLSGTPALARPAELFTQIKILDTKIFPNWTSYAKRYCDGKSGKYGFEAKGAEKLDELAAILHHSIMIRRLKKDVLHDLPEKTREILYLSGDKIKNLLEALRRSREAYTQAEKVGNKDQAHKSLLTYFYETGSAKAECIADWVLETYFYKDAAPVKILLFAHHTAVLDVFSNRFTKAKIGTIRIDGSTTDREQQCKKFQEDPRASVAILSITAAGTGITLTAANIVIFAELHWTPGILFQAEDRAHRVGQKSNVRVLYILARGTADDVIFPKIQEKISVIGNLNLLKGDETTDLDHQERVMDGIVEESQALIPDFFNIRE